MHYLEEWGDQMASNPTKKHWDDLMEGKMGFDAFPEECFWGLKGLFKEVLCQHLSLPDTSKREKDAACTAHNYVSTW